MKLIIPATFQYPPFFKDTTIVDTDLPFPLLLQRVYFVYELRKENGIQTYEPWNDTEVSIPEVIRIWKEEQDEISQLFKQRNRTAAEPLMIRFTAHYISILFWLQGTYVQSLEAAEVQLSALPIKPVNIGERLGFVMKQPGHYHSFIQLTQLYEEFEKLFVKQLLIQKRPR